MILFFNLCIRPLFLVLFPHISAEIFLKNWLTKSFKFNWMLLVGKHRHTHLLAAEIIRVQEVRIKWEYKRRLSSVKTKESTRDSVSRYLVPYHDLTLFGSLWEHIMKLNWLLHACDYHITLNQVRCKIVVTQLKRFINNTWEKISPRLLYPFYEKTESHMQ